MCYSAQVWADYKKYVRHFGADISVKEFFEIFWTRAQQGKVKIPKAMEDAFSNPANDLEREIKTLVDQYNAAEAARLEQEIFKQRTRLVDAERKLAIKATKAAAESKRIAGEKIEWALGKLADLRRQEPRPRDSRIFPGHYAPVMVMENDRLVVKPMRYQCRPAGRPAAWDAKYPGAYNARSDNLGGPFWRDIFGFTHGVMVVNAFFENVTRQPNPEQPPQNVVLEFRPNGQENMLVACLWSRWTSPGEPDLLSFAAITDEPPPEVAAAGHDRCIVPIKPENVHEWLTPQASSLERQYEILKDRERPYYEHRLAA